MTQSVTKSASQRADELISVSLRERKETIRRQAEQQEVLSKTLEEADRSSLMPESCKFRIINDLVPDSHEYSFSEDTVAANFQV